MAPLSNAHWMLDDIPAAAAAMEAPAGLDTTNGDLAEKLIRLYRVAGAPVKAARAFRKTLSAQLSPCRPWPNGIGTGWPTSIWTDGATVWLLQRPRRPRRPREPPSAGKPLKIAGNITFHQSSSSEDCRAVAGEGGHLTRISEDCRAVALDAP